MDTAVSVLQSIYDVYKTIKDGQEQFAETYDRMKALLGQLRSMEDADTLVQTKFLDDYLVLARDFLAYLERYSQRKFLSKVFHQSEMLAEVEGFKERLEALFQHFHLAMGSHIVAHNRNQEATMDELVRGMRFLLQGSNSGHVMKTMQSSDDLLGIGGGGSGVLASGPIAKALKDGDVCSLLGFLHDVKLGDGAAMALCKMAEKDEGRDAMVKAGAISSLLEKISATRPSAESTVRVHAARTIRRLALRDVYEVAIVDAGAVGRLASLLDASPVNSDAEVAAACAALANLTIQPQHKLVMLETPHLLARVVELVRSGSDAQKKHAINVLRELATNDECANAIRKAQGITVLVDLLHIGSPEQCASALSVLWTMASQEKNRSEIASVGGVNAIVAQIRRSSSDDAQRQLAASTLAVLAQDDANDSLIGETDGVELLVNLLRTGTEGQKNSAAWALAELANDAKNAAVMMREGVAPALMAAFRSGTDIQRSKAGEALAWIAQLTENKAALVKEIGLSSVVSLLRGSVDQKQNAARVVEGIAKDAKIQQQLGQLGAIELLVDLVRRHSPKDNGVKALRALAMYIANDNDIVNENAELITAAGGVDVLVDLMKKIADTGNFSTDETFDHVLEALCGTGIAELSKMIAAGGLPCLVETLKTGSVTRKRLVAELMCQLGDQDDIKVEDLAACIQALVKVIKPVEGEKLDDELAWTVLESLRYSTFEPLGRSIFVDQESGIQLLLSLLTTLSPGRTWTVWQSLGNLISDKVMAMRVVDEGALDVFQSLLTTKSEDLQRAALFGLRELIRFADATTRKRIVQRPGLCKRIIRTLDLGASEVVIGEAAEALVSFTQHREVAAELGPLHGLEALVTLIQNHTSDNESYVTIHSAETLLNLARVPENIEILVELSAVNAAVALLETSRDSKDEPWIALALLELLSAHREASEAIIASGKLIGHCVKWLHHFDDYKDDDENGPDADADEEKGNEADEHVDGNVKDEEEDDEEEEEIVKPRGEYCVVILTNINNMLTAKAINAGSNGGETTKHDATEATKEDEIEDPNTLLFYKQIIDASGLMPLMVVLEEREPGKRRDLIQLLHALAANDNAAKIRIGGVVEFLVDVVRDATDVQEQIAAAATIATLVSGSRRNAGAAIRASVGQAFIQLLKANNEVEVTEAAKESTLALITNLVALKSPNATAAAEKLVTALTSEAMAVANETCVAAFEVLEKLVETRTSCVEVLVNAGAVVVCCDALKTRGSAETMMRAVIMLSKVSRTKHRETLLENGVVDNLTAALKEEASFGPRFAEAARQTLADLSASAY